MPLLYYAYFAAALFTVFGTFYLFRKYVHPRNTMAFVAPRGLANFEDNPAPEAMAAESPIPEPAGTHLPQDSTLRRHYLTHIRYMLETVAFPHPTDSVLRRHADQLLESEWADCLKDAERLDQLLADYAAAQAEMARNTPSLPEPEPMHVAPLAPLAVAEASMAFAAIPEDSVLRRHFLTHCRFMLEEVTSPAPTDSVLARHYTQLIDCEFDACVGDEVQMAELLDCYAEHRQNASRELAS